MSVPRVRCHVSIRTVRKPRVRDVPLSRAGSRRSSDRRILKRLRRASAMYGCACAGVNQPAFGHIVRTAPTGAVTAGMLASSVFGQHPCVGYAPGWHPLSQASVRLESCWG